MFVENPSRHELQELVDYFVKDTPVIEVPGPGRNQITKAKGFRHINSDGMFMLAMTSTETTFKKNGSLRQLVRHALGAPRPYSVITYHDLAEPSNSLNFNLAASRYQQDMDAATVIVGDVHQKKAEVRTATSKDIATLNRALMNIIGIENPDTILGLND